jgi:cytochrome c-type biogenesis protein CcmF
VVVALGVHKPYVFLSFTFATFALASVVLQYTRGLRSRHKATSKNWFTSFGGMIWTNRSRYGGFIVHAGLIIVLIGITGSYAFKEVVDTDVTKGQSVALGSYVLTYDGMAVTNDAEKTTAKAIFAVSHDGKPVGYVYPVKEYYPATDQNWTRVDLYSTPTVDVYLSLLGYSEDGSTVTIQAQLNPLVGWLWFGGGVMALGGLIAMWPARRSRQKEAELTPAVAASGRRAQK